MGESSPSPFFSVVIATRDRRHLLPRAVDSVRAQTFRDFQLVIVDDGSSDGTAEWVRARMAEDSRIRLVTNPHPLGEPAAKTAGAQAAEAPWLTFLDDDDEASPKWLASFHEAIQREPTVAAVYCGVRVHTADGQTTVVLPQKTGPWCYGYQVQGLTGSYTLPRDLFLRLGGYEPSIGYGMQTEFLLRFGKYCHENRLSTAAVMEPLVTIQQAPARERFLSLRRTEGLVQGVAFLLERYPDLVTRDPAFLASQLVVGAVAAARLRRWDTCRSWLWLAVRLRWRKPLDWARLAVACLPGLRELVWAKPPDQAAKR